MSRQTALNKAKSGERTEIVLAGVGGQGLVFIGGLLGRAATARGQHAVQTQSFGVASRGGFTKSDIILAELPVAYPMVTEPDAVLALTDEAYHRYADLKPGALLLYDSDNVAVDEGAPGRGFPFTTAARRENLEGSYNVLALGALVGMTQVVPEDAIREAVDGPNLKAFELGLMLVQDERGG